MKKYIVGGYVRDSLLGLPVKDRDWVVVGATEQQMLSLGYIRVGRDFPVFLHPKTREEHALARTERKVAAGYTGFTVYAEPDVTLEQDLLRRDLTINAMALDENGELIDPFGGEQDLRQGVLRHVSEAFVEDPVRVLRIARFAARFDFRLAAQTLELLMRMVANDEVDALVPERVWAEIKKALQTPRPGMFIEVLRSCGALARILPELDGLFGVPQSIQSHPEIDSGMHTLMVLNQAVTLSDDTTVRFAALCHDLGKAATDPALWPKHTGHEEQGMVLVEQLCKRLTVPAEYRDLARLAAGFHGVCHKILGADDEQVLALLDRLDAWRRPQRFEKFLSVCMADSRGRPGFESGAYPQAGFLRRAYANCMRIDNQDLVAAGYRGAEFAEALKEMRLQQIGEVSRQG